MGVIDPLCEEFHHRRFASRSQFVKMLARAMKNFKDAGKISPWAKEVVNRAVALGLVKGDTKGNFNPKKKVTQAELAVLVSRVVGE